MSFLSYYISPLRLTNSGKFSVARVNNARLVSTRNQLCDLSWLYKYSSFGESIHERRVQQEQRWGLNLNVLNNKSRWFLV